MSVYLITYELHFDKDYQKINEAIESLGGCIHCLRSIWLVIHGLSITEVHEILKESIDDDDSLLILKPSREWESLNMPHRLQILAQTSFVINDFRNFFRNVSLFFTYGAHRISLFLISTVGYLSISRFKCYSLVSHGHRHPEREEDSGIQGCSYAAGRPRSGRARAQGSRREGGRCGKRNTRQRI